jgi:hypothetical protein
MLFNGGGGCEVPIITTNLGMSLALKFPIIVDYEVATPSIINHGT